MAVENQPPVKVSDKLDLSCQNLDETGLSKHRVAETHVLS